MDGIAAALEVALDRPALIFDGRLQLAGHGPMAAARLGEAELAELRMDAARLTREQALGAAAELDVEPRHVEDLFGLGPGTGLAVVARHDTLGYLFVLDAGEPDLPGLELRALEQASVAVAMEGLRRRSAADERAREDFLWLLVTGAAGPPDPIVARAALLGFECSPFELAVARADTGLERVARDLRDRATRVSLELGARRPRRCPGGGGGGPSRASRGAARTDRGDPSRTAGRPGAWRPARGRYRSSPCPT